VRFIFYREKPIFSGERHMKKTHSELSPKDQRVRKWWLILLLLLSVPGFLIFALLFGKLIYEGFTCGTSWCCIWLYMFSVLLSLGWFLSFYIPYRCAYKSPGTILLTILLIICPLTFVRELSSLGRDGTNPTGYILFLIFAPFSIWWYVLSLKLRKINKKIRAELKELSR
jgi:hypothetical protein